MLTEDAALVNYLDKILKQVNGITIVAPLSFYLMHLSIRMAT